MQFERRKDKRYDCSKLTVEIFLSRGMEGPAITPNFQAKLVGLSRQGADVALEEIMHEQTHLALGPMGSSKLQLNITLPAENKEETCTISAKPTWFDKKTGTGMRPFRIGLEFSHLLSNKHVQMINELSR